MNIIGHFLSFVIAFSFVISLMTIATIVAQASQGSSLKANEAIMDFEVSNTAAHAPQTAQQVSEILSQGYIGTYGASQALPFSNSKNPTIDTPLLVPFSQPSLPDPQKGHTSSIPFVRADWEIVSKNASLGRFASKTTAATPKWQAKKVKQSYATLRIDAGKAATFWVDFQNTGTETWRSTGKHFIALNVTNPSGRESPFQHMFWPKSFRPAVMKEKEVPPGKTARIFFALQAPDSGGTFEESFALVAENAAWIHGGEVKLTIKVNNPPSLYRAKKVRQSYDAMNITPGKAFTFWVEFKNTGSVPWYKEGDHFIALNVSDPSGRTSPFQHESWKEFPYRPTRLDQKKVAPGEVGRFTFALRAPEKVGAHVENFHIVAENLTWIQGGHMKLPITVKPKPDKAKKSENEPMIRIGLYEPTEAIDVKNFYGTSTLQKTSGEIIESLSENAGVVLGYQNGTYTAAIGDRNYTDTQPFRIVGESNKGVLEIMNYDNKPPWNPALNDNTFRSTLELAWSTRTQTLWVVNELPLESYLYGIAEAGNENDMDYLKALITAARTYVLYHYQHPTKYAGAPFLLTSTAADQVYRGFGFETRAPNIAKAAQETHGQVVTYQGEVVVTPYFSQSDGRTRAWEEVWAGGPKPWLISVLDPCCTGKDLLGHGIGMSAAGARYFAQEGKIWDWIVKYYYTGIKLQEWY